METIAESAAISDDQESLCAEIVEAVAAAKGVDSRELTPPLYDVIDPDALTQLVESGKRSGSDVAVTFDYGNWQVQILGDDVVSVTPRIGTEAARNVD